MTIRTSAEFIALIDNLGIDHKTAILFRDLAESINIDNTQDAVGGASIALSAGAATDEMDITVTLLDEEGTTLAEAQNIEVWISDSATTKVLTSTSASGALTAVDGAVLSVLTAKKHITCVTPVTGIINLSLVDSANTAGEVVYVKLPNGRTAQSIASVAGDYEGG